MGEETDIPVVIDDDDDEHYGHFGYVVDKRRFELRFEDETEDLVSIWIIPKSRSKLPRGYPNAKTAK